jgi:hypothetical protein
MRIHSHRLAIAVLLSVGLLAATPLWLESAPPALPAEMLQLPAAWLVQFEHRQFMVGLLGATLILAAFIPWLRLPAIGASVLSKLAFVVVAAATTAGADPIGAQVWLEAALAVALLAAAFVLWQESREEERWNSGRGWQMEA